MHHPLRHQNRCGTNGLVAGRVIHYSSLLGNVSTNSLRSLGGEVTGRLDQVLATDTEDFAVVVMEEVYNGRRVGWLEKRETEDSDDRLGESA